MKLFKFTFLILGILSPLFAYTHVPIDNFSTSAVYGKKKPRSKAEAISQIQAFFIKRMLTDPVFNKSEIYYDEEDLDFINLAQHEMMNDILSQKMAEKLSEQDLLKFEDRFLKRSR